MRVRALQSFASPLVIATVGQEFDLPDENAVAWIKAGLVERVPDEPEAAVMAEAEVAVPRKGRR